MLPLDAQARKAIPIYSGFVKYFPRAIAAVAELSRKGNDQHNPGKELFWDRSKSGDEMDALMRHIVDGVTEPQDVDGVLHATKSAWRAMANLEKTLEARAWVAEVGDVVGVQYQKTDRPIWEVEGEGEPTPKVVNPYLTKCSEPSCWCQEALS